MPKLEAIKGGLGDLRKRLEARQKTDDVSRETLVKALNEGFGDRISGLFERLLKETETRNQQSRTETFRAIIEVLKVLNENDKVLSGNIEELNGQVGFTTGSVSDAQKKSFDDLKDMIDKNVRSHNEMLMGVQLLVQKLPKSFPEYKATDLSVVEAMLAEALERLKIEPKPTVWEFDIHRDVNNLIESVTARSNG